MNNWDQIPKQTLLVENGEIGDCWRCCIAAVLGIPADKVPHFQANDAASGTVCTADTQKWLNERGMFMIHTSGQALLFSCWSNSGFEPPPIIACGPSPRSKSMVEHHAVVMIGSKQVYDPHPSEDGLTAICEQYLIFRPPC